MMLRDIFTHNRKDMGILDTGDPNLNSSLNEGFSVWILKNNKRRLNREQSGKDSGFT
jgi:hypothetical protein